jgi:putative acetyltransferase
MRGDSWELPTGSVLVRDERPEDAAAVRRVNALAFGRAAEADLVDELRRAGAVARSLVAEAGGAIVGHILFSPVVIHGTGLAQPAVGLGPVAVLPAAQRRGIGSALVREGLRRCRDDGQRAAVVLGAPEYYRRFGFTSARARGLRSEYAAPPEAFMVAALAPGALAGADGVVVYHPAFGRV